jgi:hypothetical protein
MKSTKQADSKTNSSVVPADGLFKGWLTGYSYRACKSLYFEKGDLFALQPDERTELLRWLYTYKFLVDEWKIGNPSNLIENMIKDVETKSSTKSAEVTQFDSLFAGVAGNARAKAQYSYYAILSSADVNELNFSNNHKKSLELLNRLKQSVSELRNAPPSGAYLVIQHDISKMASKMKKCKEKTLANASDDPYHKDLKQRTREWSALILGTLSVRDILTEKGKAVLHVLVALVGILLFSLVGGILVIIFFAVPYAFNVNLSTLTLSVGKDLVSTLSTVVSILATVGLSLSLLVTKAWNSLKAFEPLIAVQLAKQRKLRRIQESSSN